MIDRLISVEMKKFILIFIIAGIFSIPCLAKAATIDSMTISDFFFYNPGSKFLYFGKADEYFLNDGTSWKSGAGSFGYLSGDLQSIEKSGSIIRYRFVPPSTGILYSYTDYNGGDHSSQGELEVAGPLVLEAEIGSSTAKMSGSMKITSNEETWYGEPKFNHFSSYVGALVKYSISYTLQGATWTENLFDNSFTYSLSGYIDFTPPPKGDIDGDGDIDLQDAILALQVLVGRSPSTNFFASSDLNGNNRIGLEEAIYALQHIARLRNNHDPILDPIGDKAVDEGKELIFTISATDKDNDHLTYSVSSLPSGANFNGDIRTFSWSPTYSQSGMYQVTFIVRDAYGGEASETIAITVNDKPPVYTAAEYYPINVGDWHDYIDTMGTTGHSSITGTKFVGAIPTLVEVDWAGVQTYVTSNQNGIKIYGQYDPTYNIEIIFDPPLIMLPNVPQLGTPQVSMASYSMIYLGQLLHVNVTSTVNVIGIEDVQTQSMVLKDCVKISSRLDQFIVELGQYMTGETSYQWYYKGVGLVKQVVGTDTYTITGSYVNGVQQTY